MRGHPVAEQPKKTLDSGSSPELQNSSNCRFAYYDTASQAGVQLKIAWIPACAEMTNRDYTVAHNIIYNHLSGTQP
jgi:hypothetical protein